MINNWKPLEPTVRQLVTEVWISSELIEKTITLIIAILNWQVNGAQVVKEWNEKLYLLKRFNTINNMVYRDYVWIHQHRLANIIINYPYFILFNRKHFDLDYAKILASHHDITEWISPLWDIITPTKIGLNKNLSKLLEKIELACIELILMNFKIWWVTQKTQKKLYLDSLYKSTFEWKLVSYLDKLDWFMVCFHEITAGNNDFIKPFKGYLEIFKKIKSLKLYPELSHLFYLGKIWFEQYLKKTNSDKSHLQQLILSTAFFDINTILAQENKLKELLKNWKFHDINNINYNDFWFPAYQAWKNATLSMNQSHNLWWKYFNPT